MKRILFTILCLLLISFNTNAQFSYKRLVEKGKYSKVLKKAKKKLTKDPNNVIANYDLSIIYNIETFKKFDVNIAYSYSKETKSLFQKADLKNKQKLAKNNLTLDEINKQAVKICASAFKLAKTKNTIEAYNYFISHFIDSKELINNATNLRNSIAFNNACNTNTIVAYQSFIDKYPLSNDIHTAKTKRNFLAFERAKGLNTVESLQSFITTYPKAKQINQAIILRNKIAFENAKNINTVESLQFFINTYPKAKEINSAIKLRDSLAFNKAKFKDTSKEYLHFLNTYPKTETKYIKEVEFLYEKAIFYERTSNKNYLSYITFLSVFSDNRFCNTAIDSLIAIGVRESNIYPLRYVINHTKDSVMFTNVLKKYYSVISTDGELSTLELFKYEFINYIDIIEDFQDDYNTALLAKEIGLTVSVYNNTSNDDDNNELNKRLQRESAKSGSIQISLMWDKYNDLDLHCVDPFGEEIFYGHKFSNSGGELDVDMNVNPESLRPVENIYWEKGKAPPGVYKIYLDYFKNHNCGNDCKDPLRWLIRVKTNNTIKTFKGRIRTGERNKFIYSFDYKNYEFGNINITPANIKKLEKYIRKAAPKDLAFVALQKLIAPIIKKKNYKYAAKKIKSYKLYFGDDKRINDLIRILEENTNHEIVINTLPLLNTDEGDEYSPVISADNNSIFFCGKNRINNIGKEDIFISTKQNNKWNAPVLLETVSSEETNDAPMGLSTDGNILIQFLNGKLGYRNKTIDGWSDFIFYSDEINKGEWNGDAMLTSDGKALIFSSVRKGNFDYCPNMIDGYHGENYYNSDIYVSIKQNNKWSKPINIGNPINTIYSERSPFLHPDMKTLYFSSNGHAGLGKYDVYVTKRLSDTCWNCWSTPVNLGKEINTINNDWGYKISTDGEKAYFSKKDQSDNIYSINLPPSLRPDLVTTIQGRLTDTKETPVEATIKWENLETGEMVGESKSNPKDGSFFIVLPLGKIYGYYIDKDKYFPISNNIDLRQVDTSITQQQNIEIVSIENMINQGIAVPVNNLFFPINKDKLLPESLPELKRVAAIIKANNLKVEISGHTDSTGTNEHNMSLSLSRANAVKDFLISLGIKIDFIEVKGYGDTMPIASNDTEIGMAKNRRVELKFK